MRTLHVVRQLEARLWTKNGVTVEVDSAGSTGGTFPQTPHIVQHAFTNYDLLRSGQMNPADARPQWRPLNTPAELQELMHVFGDFHDACVREIHVATGHYVEENLSMQVDWKTTVHMLIQRQFRDPSAIELRFEEVVALHVSPPRPNYDSIIFDAAFFVRNGVYYWAERGDWAPESSSDRETTCLAARKVYWREASDWLGPTLRYHANAE